ncbi:MAG TPA: cytochrome d ubiquinol oxidase subunit II [Nevskiaceae bacterium]|nr:cytochrome d ubiquinol oxidase subunit II [Nevskiaceae bacterium]
MNQSHDALPLVWMLFMAASISLYVMLDGFTLGIGILFPFARGASERDRMMASVSPVWDGNQTWLVSGGMALFAAFPAAYHLLLNALYIPVLVMVIALVFRGVAFEFRVRDNWRWNAAFIGGSTAAALCQGLILGTYVLGFEYDGKTLVTRPLDFISPFSCVVAASLVLDYALLGACWLAWKSEGELRAWALAQARRLLLPVAAGVGGICIWMPLQVPAIWERWFSWPNMIFLSPVPIWSTVLLAILWRLLTRKNLTADVLPFLCCIGLYLLALTGLAVSLWPYVVPRALTFWDVAAPEESLLFTMVGVFLITPVILVYTAHAYWVFRGKVADDAGYHH